jgi:uncharacterized RDD family membrane protein YckC
MIGERDLRLVTPEAVVLQFDTAGLPSRLFARLLDLVVQVIALFVFLFLGGLIGSAVGDNESQVLDIILVVLGTVLLFLLLLGYEAIFETVWKGKTPGKAALGLRVMTAEGAPIRFRHAAIRSALSLVDVFLFSGLIGIIAILVTRNNQRLGDLVAGTIVVRERSATKAPTAISFPVPHGCEAYADTLDVSAVTQAEYGAIRSFLMRAGTLAPQVRSGLAADLGSPLVQRMHHVPPSWVGPELFLACVAAVYQRRFGALPVPAPAWQAPAPLPASSSWGVARPTAPPAADAAAPMADPTWAPDERPVESARPTEGSGPAADTGFEAPS